MNMLEYFRRRPAARRSRLGAREPAEEVGVEVKSIEAAGLPGEPGGLEEAAKEAAVAATIAASEIEAGNEAEVGALREEEAKTDAMDLLKRRSVDAARYIAGLAQTGSLRYEVGEYVGSEAFLKLLGEYEASAAVRIYEAERLASEAYQAGRESAIDEMYSRREMPRSMRSGSPMPAEIDFGRMSSEEFARFRDRLARS